MQDVADCVRRGESLTSALTSSCHGLPPFFVPVIEAGEVTGRVDDSLRFLETHCRLLAHPAAAMRNVWLVPLAVIVAGTVLRFLAILCWGSWGGVLAFIWGSLTSYAALALCCLSCVGHRSARWSISSNCTCHSLAHWSGT